MQKKLHFEFLEAKREENKLRNEEHTDEIVEKAKVIARHRDQLRNQKEVERKKKKLEAERKAQLEKEIRERGMLEVRQKIEQKKDKMRKEEQEFESIIRDIKLKRQFLQQGKAVVEENAFRQIEDGVERKIRNRQNKDLIEQYEREQVHVFL